MDAIKECPVCRDKLKDPIRLSECKHEFCRSCLQESIRLRKHCPLCRVPVNGDPLTAVPSQTRRSRVRNGSRHSRHLMIPPFNGRSVFAGIWNPNSQLIASPNQSGSANPNFALPPTPLILPAAPAPVPRSPGPLFWTSTTSQTSDPVGLRHSRTFRNSNIPWLNMYSHSDCSILHVQNLLVEQAQAEQRGQMINNSVRVFACPYCQLGGMDELDLRDHCNAHHRFDPTPVVCPVCVSLPHGDENYYSQNFISHLNVRHSYYSQDITDIHQSDDMNMQVAILESFITSH